MNPQANHALAIALSVFALRALLAVDARVLDPDGLLGWFTFPTGVWFPLVAAGAGFLAWLRVDRWRSLPAAQGVRATAAFAVLAGLAGLWARLTGVADVWVFAALFAAAALAARRGMAGVRVQLTPLLFLLFAVAPPPRLVNEAFWWIQSVSADAATALLHASGAPVLGQGIALTTPTEVFGIVESCTALGILIVLTAGAVLARESLSGAGRRSWWLVALAPPIALLLNLVRITTIVLHPPLNRVHHLGQWATLLALGAVLLALLARVLSRPGGAPVAAPGPGAPPGASPGTAHTALAVAALLAVVSLVPRPTPRAELPMPPLRSIPTQHGDWTARDVTLDPLFLGFVMFRESVARRYERDGDVVDLFVGEASPRSTVSSPFSPKTLLPGLGWVPVRGPERDPARLSPPPSQTAWVARDAARWWVVQWRFGDPGLAAESLRQLLALDASPFAAHRPRRVIRLATPVRDLDADGVALAQRRLADFADAFDASLFPDAPVASAGSSDGP
ncbi:MAG: exosortase/archaeosortase family protein [Myxococcota bacterium]